MKIQHTALVQDQIFQLRISALAIGLGFIFFSILFQLDFEPGRWMTYRDFDYPEETNFINYLSPGVKDM